MISSKLCKTAAIIAFCTCSNAIFASSTPTNQTDKLSYAFGYETAQAFTKRNVTINVEQFQAGLQDGYSGKKTTLTKEQMQSAIKQFQKEQIATAKKRKEQLAEKNLQKSQKFLAQNKNRKGVITLKDGLQYKIIHQGHGKTPSSKDTVVVAYEGKLIDGTVFDSSYKRNKDATFPVNAVIKGWSQALQKMKKGSTWMLYIPPELAYGENGLPFAPIGPNAALIFKVELKDIKKS